MGNCVTVQKNSLNSEMKLAVQIQSPTKQKTTKIDQNTVGHRFLPQTTEMGHEASFQDLSLSSKEEMFFDSQAWLESDCEDYFSVNGDLTPSSGNSPIHHKSAIDTPHLDKIVYTDSTPMPNSLPEPSPTDMKKQLIELFRESFSDGCSDGDQNLHGQQEAKPTVFDLPPKSTSPYELVPNSVCNSERTPYREIYSRKGKSSQYSQCCIPSLMRSLSFTERKKGLSSASA
ncbi:uncharacterized protein At3g27210-like [Pistacia vera]|uniref:uncharacterized protein At3g27210-like n=1 Tax=Pistacia vera TaxID=55513 RepID=UPI001262E371|nr:uncharacterized protein At3g27210-like [Pistacia vera]